MSGYLVIVAGPLNFKLDIDKLPEIAQRIQCIDGKVSGQELFNMIDEMYVYLDSYEHASTDVSAECIASLVEHGVLEKSGSSIYTITAFDEPIEIHQFTFVYMKSSVHRRSDHRANISPVIDQSDVIYILLLVNDNIDSFSARIISSNDPIEWDNIIAVFNSYRNCKPENDENTNIHILTARLSIIFMYENYEIPRYSADAKSNIIEFYISLDSFYSSIEDGRILVRPEYK
jgi:hypothetical protein